MRNKPTIEFYRGLWHLLTPHPDGAYRNLLVWRGNGNYADGCLVPHDGEAFVALGGEWAPGYRLLNGAEAEPFELRPGDIATRMRTDLPFELALWRIERAPTPNDIS